MAKTKDENGDGGKTENVDPNVLLAGILQQMIANQPKRVITEDSPEYQDRLRAEGHFDVFEKPVYQNGHEAAPKGLSAQTRERAVALQPGKYVGGKVTVEATSDGGVHLKYKSKSVEDRMSQPWKDFTDLIDRIWADMHPV